MLPFCGFLVFGAGGNYVCASELVCSKDAFVATRPGIIMDMVSFQGTRHVDKGNEDALLAAPESAWFALADGVSESPGGGLSSQTLIQATQTFLDTFVPSSFAQASYQTIFDDLILTQINLLKSINPYPLKEQPLASTLILAHISKGRLYAASIGNSDLFLIRGGTLFELSEHHTLENRYRQMGIWDILPNIEKAKGASLTSYMGANVDFPSMVNYISEDLQPGDLVILASDGLREGLSLEEIRTIAPNLSAEHLAKLAVLSGSGDDISLIKIKF